MPNVIQKLIQEYSQKTYTELLALSDHFQFDLPELEKRQHTVKFIKVADNNDALKIIFRPVHGKTPKQTLKKYTQHYAVDGTNPKASREKAAKALNKTFKEGGIQVVKDCQNL